MWRCWCKMMLVFRTPWEEEEEEVTLTNSGQGLCSACSTCGHLDELMFFKPVFKAVRFSILAITGTGSLLPSWKTAYTRSFSIACSSGLLYFKLESVYTALQHSNQMQNMDLICSMWRDKFKIRKSEYGLSVGDIKKFSLSEIVIHGGYVF